MAIINPTLPTPGELNVTEDIDTRNVLVALLNLVNGGIDKDNLAAAAGILATQMGQGAAGLGAGAFHASNSDAAAQLAAAGVGTKVKFNSKEFDPSNWFDAALWRYQPQIAGSYALSSYVELLDNLDDGQALNVELFKNGVLHRKLGRAVMRGINVGGVGGACRVQANGSTDYFEVFANQGGAAAARIQVGAKCWFSGDLIGRS